MDKGLVSQEKIKNKYDLAVNYYRDKKIEDSEKVLNQILSEYPLFADAYNLLGVINLDKEMYDNATEFIYKAISIDPKESFYKNLIVLYSKQEKNNEVLNVLKQAIEVYPTNLLFIRAIASSYMKSNRLDDAYIYYSRILDINTVDFEANLYLGTIKFLKNQFDSALFFFEKVYGINKKNLNLLKNYAACYLIQNKMSEALNIFLETINLFPDSSDAYFHAATCYYNLGNKKEAESYFQRYIQKEEEIKAIDRIGAFYLEKKDYNIALNCFQKILKVFPNNYKANNNMGGIYYYQEKYVKAEKHFRKALEINPNDYNIYVNIGVCLRKQKKYDEAADFYEKAISLNPKVAHVYANYANVYLDQKQQEKAIELTKKALAINPQSEQALNNYGLALSEIYRYDEAIEKFHQALKYSPDYEDVFYNLGNTHFFKLDFVKAEEYYRKLFELNPSHVRALSNISLMYLLLEDYEKGWKLYENRFKTSDFDDFKIYEPFWKGEDIDGKVVFVYHEQGFGDTINFIRYLELLKKKGAQVIFKVQPELRKLFEDSNLGVDLVTSNDEISSVSYDYASPLLSLPKLFNTDKSNIPGCERPYLLSNKDKEIEYRQKYFDNDLFKIGICWKGSAGNTNDVNRSIPIERFLCFKDIPGVKLYSFQKGSGEEQLLNVSSDIDIVDLGSTFNDFSDTVAAMQNIDVLISVDTAVVHIAGALCKPCGVLLSYRPDWRWILGTEDSHWYNSLKLFRQKEVANWDYPFEAAMNYVKSIIQQDS